ncbi:MAG: carbohydrate porin [Colwellia sp.]
MRKQNLSLINRMVIKKTLIAISIATAVISVNAFAVDFYGYGRAGISTTASGGVQHCYGDVVDGSHYVGTLGDECDSYLELGLGKGYDTKSGAKFYFETMLSARALVQGNDYQSYTTPSSPLSRADLSLRQLNARVSNIFDSSPDTTLWIGKRFYQRKDVHLMDLYYLNNSGYGAGLEKLPLGVGNISVAWMVGAHETTRGKADVNGEMTTQVQKLDLRYENIPLWNDVKLNVALIYGVTDLTEVQDKANESGGNGVMYTAEVKHTIGSSTNTAVFQYGNDVLANNVFHSLDGAVFDQYVSWEGEISDAYRFIYFGQAPISDAINLQYSVLYASGDTYDSGIDVPENNPQRMSFVFRPSYTWNDISQTTLELGYTNYKFASDSESQDLGKIMLSQEVAVDIGLANKPTLRFYTGAFFGEVADRTRSGNADGEANNWRFGAQVEAWW